MVAILVFILFIGISEAFVSSMKVCALCKKKLWNSVTYDEHSPMDFVEFSTLWNAQQQQYPKAKCCTR